MSAITWFKKPKVEIVKDDERGKEYAVITLREGNAVFGVQPNPDHLVFFNLAADGLPISFTLMEKVDGICMSQVFTTLTPDGVGTKDEHHFIPIDAAKFFEILAKAFKKISEIERRLPEPAGV